MYLIENREFLNQLLKFGNAKNISRDNILNLLKERSVFLRNSTQKNPTFLYQNANKPVVVLE